MEAAVIALSLRSLDEYAKFSTSFLDRVSFLPQCFSKLKGSFPFGQGLNVRSLWLTARDLCIAPLFFSSCDHALYFGHLAMLSLRQEKFDGLFRSVSARN